MGKILDKICNILAICPTLDYLLRNRLASVHG